MTSWIVSPPERTDWRLDRAELVTLLSRDWPTAQIIDREEPRFQTEDLVWMIQGADGDLEGSLDVDGNGIYLDGPFGTVSSLAAWLRTVVPASIDLVLCTTTCIRRHAVGFPA